jgi:hypothetical protein
MGSAEGVPGWLGHVICRLRSDAGCHNIDRNRANQGGTVAEQKDPTRRCRSVGRGIRRENSLTESGQHRDHTGAQKPAKVTSTETVGFTPTCPPIAQPTNTTSLESPPDVLTFHRDRQSSDDLIL